MSKYIRGNILSVLQWPIHCQVYQSFSCWEIAHQTSSRNILLAIAVLTSHFSTTSTEIWGAEIVTALIFVIKFRLISMGPSTSTQAVLKGHPGGDDQPVFWTILLALGCLADGHTKVLLVEPIFGPCELGLRHTPLCVPTMCNWK